MIVGFCARRAALFPLRFGRPVYLLRLSESARSSCRRSGFEIFPTAFLGRVSKTMTSRGCLYAASSAAHSARNSSGDSGFSAQNDERDRLLAEDLNFSRSRQACSDVFRSPVQAVVMSGREYEAVVPIERDGVVVDGVDDNEPRRRGFASVNRFAKRLGEQ